MKKVLGTGLLAMCALACVQQEASAWINSRFSVGLSWDWQSANNKLFWGAWRNGPFPESYGTPMLDGYAPGWEAPS